MVNRSNRNRLRILEKVLNTVKDKHGNLIQTGTMPGGEYKLDEGCTIKCGKDIAFQVINKQRKKYFMIARHRRELNKIFERHEKLTAMGIAPTYNRLRAPLQGPLPTK